MIDLSLARPLTVGDTGVTDVDDVESIRAFCDRFAARLIERYLAQGMSWESADLAINRVYDLMICHCGTKVPRFAWDVFLAFDGGECSNPKGDSFTRPHIEALARGGSPNKSWSVP